MTSSGVSYRSGAFHSKSSESIKVDTDSRDLKAQCDHLHKELERKDARNEKMTKEMQQVRSSYANLQREMRMTMATIDKIKSEKQQAEETAADLRTKNTMVMRKLKTANDPQGLIDEISREKKNLLFLDENIVNLRGELSLREKKIEALTKELVIAHRSLEAQTKYEPLSSSQPGVANNREVMRTLYFDMGKKQADLHSVTLAFADAVKKLDTTNLELARVIEQKEHTNAENEKLKGNIEYLGRQSIEYNDEIMHLRRELNAHKQQCAQLQHSLDDASQEITDARACHAEVDQQQQAHIAELTSALAVMQHERDSTREKLEVVQSSVSTKDSIYKVREHNLLEEVARLTEKNTELGDQQGQCRALQSQLEDVRAKLAESEGIRDKQEKRVSELLRLLSQKESALIETNSTAQALESNLSSLHSELTRLRDQCQLVTAERNESVEALRHTMKATRELSQKYHQEREARLAVERTNEQLLQAKANLSNATLDALYQERRKSAALEKSLALVPLVLKWRSACIPEGSTVPAAKGSASDGEEFAHYYSSSTSAASTGEGDAPKDAAGKNLSHISKELDTSRGLQEGVNATFDWLLNEKLDAKNTKEASATEEKSGEALQMEAGVDGERAATGIIPPATPAAPPPVDGGTSAEAFPPSPSKSPGVAAIMAEAYRSIGTRQSDVFAAALAAGTDSPGSMVGELRRLRDELRVIEGKAPELSMLGGSASSGLADTSVNSSFISSTSTTLHKTFGGDNSTLNNISVTTSMNLSASK